MWREFHNDSRAGKTRVWRIKVDGEVILTEFGEAGGQMQAGKDYGVAKHVGASNEISAEADAINEAERLIRGKKRQGYVEVGATEARVTRIDPRAPLPENLRFYKPDNEISDEMLLKISEDRVIYTRKRDGEAMIFRTDGNGDLEIYSRRMHAHHHTEGPELPWTKRFPHLVEEFYDLNIPANTIILGEMVRSPEDDDRWYVAQVMKSKTMGALKAQAESGNLHFYIWDIAQWDGEELLQTVPVLERYELVEEVFASATYFVAPDLWGPEDIRSSFAHQCRGKLPKEAEFGPIIYPDHYPHQWKQAVALAMTMGWEGWVVVDPHMGFGDKSFTFLGKDYRPRACSAKIKPDFEDDFIAKFDPGKDEGSWGRGKRTGTIGSVALYQLDDKGEEHYICECGGGITDEFAQQFSNPALFPMVLKVQYATRTYARDGKDTNALQFPRIIDIRTDKGLDECINPRLTPREKCGSCTRC